MQTSKALSDWPKDGRPADFEDIVNGVLIALKSAYNMTSRQKKSLPVEGPTWTGDAVSHDTYWYFSKEGIRYERDRGRNMLTVIISDAVRRGIEQGRRLERKHL